MANEKYDTPLLLKSLPVIFLVMVAVSPLQAQGDYQSFYTGSLKINNTGMYILGSWAIANITVWAYGLACVLIYRKGMRK